VRLRCDWFLKARPISARGIRRCSRPWRVAIDGSGNSLREPLPTPSRSRSGSVWTTATSGVWCPWRCSPGHRRSNLARRQPLALSTEELTRRTDLPLDWRDQQRLLTPARWPPHLRPSKRPRREIPEIAALCSHRSFLWSRDAIEFCCTRADFSAARRTLDGCDSLAVDTVCGELVSPAKFQV
jgi:hypothetical protein